MCVVERLTPSVRQMTAGLPSVVETLHHTVHSLATRGGAQAFGSWPEDFCSYWPPPRICQLQFPTLARADISTHVLVGKSSHSSVDEGSLTWESDSPSSLRRDHRHLIRRHCGVKVIGGGYQGVDSAYGEVCDKSRDDFDCMCYEIKEGLGSFSYRCVNARVGADHEQRR